MLYRITNNGEARTVDFLAVFAEGETQEFDDTKVQAYQHMNGVPLVWALPENFDVEFIGEKKDKEDQ